MKKTFVLDTNVLLSNPEALFTFDDNDVVIPEAVLEELDNKKHGHDQINVNAREVARKLYHLKQINSNTLFGGIVLENGGTLTICPASKIVKKSFSEAWDNDKKDNEIAEKDREIARLKVLLNMDGTNAGIPTSMTPINKKNNS